MEQFRRIENEVLEVNRLTDYMISLINAQRGKIENEGVSIIADEIEVDLMSYLCHAIKLKIDDTITTIWNSQEEVENYIKEN